MFSIDEDWNRNKRHQWIKRQQKGVKQKIRPDLPQRRRLHKIYTFVIGDTFVTGTAMFIVGVVVGGLIAMARIA